MSEPTDSLPTPQRIAELVEDSRNALSQIHVAMDEERAFCWKLQQYLGDTGNTLNRQRTQPRDQTPYRQMRFSSGELLAEEPYFKARPVDPNADPQTAKWARWAVDFDITDPTKRFDRVIQDVVRSGFSSRVGCAHVYWDPDRGAFGDTGFMGIDGKDIGWAPPFVDPHDPDCPWFYHIARMRPEQIARSRGWKNAKDVMPDRGPSGSGSAGNQNAFDVSGKVTMVPLGKAEIGEMQTQEFTTVVFFWERFGGSAKSNVGHRVLSDSERYMAISEGENAGQRVSVDYGPDPLPPFDVISHDSPGMLPDGTQAPSGTPIKRIDVALSEEERIAYPNGKLTICAPWSGEGIVFYEDDWPQPMRTFPYLVWQPDASPFEQIGTSDVDLNWTMTLVKNATIRRWYEQLQESRGFMMIPGRGIKDLNDEPFRYTDANGFVAIYDGAALANPPRFVQGPEPSAQLQAFISFADQNIRGNEGSTDIPVANPNELKGVQVGVMQQAVRSGNTKANDHVRSWQVELGMFLSVVHDIQRARWTMARWVRYLGPQGRDAWMRLRGSDIPQADIVISARPTLDALHSEQLDSVLKLANLASTNPAAARVAARHMDIDPDDLKDILSSAQPPMPPRPPGMPPGMPPGAPPLGGPPGPPMPAPPGGGPAPLMSAAQ